MTQKLIKANQYIEKEAAGVNPEYRNKFHLMAPIGWINDPNGFIYFRGEYHLFYQYNPYDSVWGPMYWGHAKSKDLMHWEYLPVALAPGDSYDRDGCFSGSAIEKDGKLYLLYTGHNVDGEKTRQVQCLAVSEDGVNFEKYSKNPVIEEKHLEGIAECEDFRDPKVFRKGNFFYTVVAAKTVDSRGQILLFQSKDLVEWKFYSVLLEGEKKQGIMWECPDLFHLDGKDVLIMSPIQMEEEGLSYKNTSSTVAFIGAVDWESGRFCTENYHEIDFGLDFYAPQTCENSVGERVMVAWMQMWNRRMPTNELGHGWAGSMTFPRRLSIVDNQLCQRPATSIYQAIKIEHQIKDKKMVNQTLELKDEVCNQHYMSLEMEMSNHTKINVQYAKGLNEAIIFCYDVEKELFTLSRERAGHEISGAEKELLTQRSVVLHGNKLKLEILRDTSSIEVFLDGGKAMTVTFFEIEKGRDFSLSVEGSLKLTLESGKINQ